MDTNPNPRDNLSDVERRLAAWEPARAGLDPDAMLFAAGRAAARPGPARFVWPALAGAMTLAAIVLAVGLGLERSQRLSLTEQLRHAPAALSPTTAPPASSLPAPTEFAATSEAKASSLLASHMALEKGLEAWPAQAIGPLAAPGAPSQPIYHVGQRDGVLDP
jgi:hypothetical protein